MGAEASPEKLRVGEGVLRPPAVQPPAGQLCVEIAAAGRRLRVSRSGQTLDEAYRALPWQSGDRALQLCCRRRAGVRAWRPALAAAGTVCGQQMQLQRVAHAEL